MVQWIAESYHSGTEKRRTLSCCFNRVSFYMHASDLPLHLLPPRMKSWCTHHGRSSSCTPACETCSRSIVLVGHHLDKALSSVFFEIWGSVEGGAGRKCRCQNKIACDNRSMQVPMNFSPTQSTLCVFGVGIWGTLRERLYRDMYRLVCTVFTFGRHVVRLLASSSTLTGRPCPRGHASL
eukprot:4108277-Amphidinium_carterae.1